MSEYLSSNFYNNDGAIAQGANGYQRLLMDHSNTSSILIVYYGICIRLMASNVDNSSIGVG